MSGKGCPVETGECLAWAHKYLKDCICSFRDEVSLGLGLLSVFSWGVAEVPQIITNFKEKTTEGVSLAFLMTWVLGDVFNLAGCWLEPATLPTQFYMALLYTFTTIILVGQTIYYDYLRRRFHPPASPEPTEDGAQKPIKLEGEGHTRPHPIVGAGSSSPEQSSSVISVPHSRRSSRDLYYMSARSLASSHTPTVGSYLVGSRESGGHTQSFLRSSGSVATTAANEDDSSMSPTRGATDSSAGEWGGGGGGGGGMLTRTVQAAAGSMFLVGTVGLSSNFLSGGSVGFAADQAGGRRALLRASRRLLVYSSGLSRGGSRFRMPQYHHQNVGDAEAVGPWGEVFGWCMAAIYMGGRLPQILLNIKRGTVEGLNPLMFVFALMGNVTYVSSILVRTLEWTQIKPNMPWLVDAGVCVVLDIFIICQFVYYAARVPKVDSEPGHGDKKGDYQLLN